MKSIGLVPELYCSNIERTTSFYVDLLGFNILYQRPEEKFIYLEKGNARIMIEQIGVGRNWIMGDLEYPFGRGMNFQIETDSINDLYEKVKGNKLILEIEEKWYQKDTSEVGHRQFIIQDPDGYLLRFYQDLGVR